VPAKKNGGEHLVDDALLPDEDLAISSRMISVDLRELFEQVEPCFPWP